VRYGSFDENPSFVTQSSGELAGSPERTRRLVTMALSVVNF
jgi:hypothetical protein